MLKKVSDKIFNMDGMGIQGIFFPEQLFSGNKEMPEKQLDIPLDTPGLQEYRLVIKPGTEVYNKIAEEKENFYSLYKEKVAVKTKPHIVVAHFLAKESMEETMIRWMQRICSRQRSFLVTLNNYSGFPPHTIYLRVLDHEPFKILARELKTIDEYIRSNGCPKAYLVNRPHLSIARRLPESVYEKAMLEYSQKLFCESFLAGELVLMRRSGPFATWKLVNVFGLLPQENNLVN